jgi:hypothetical protein
LILYENLKHFGTKLAAFPQSGNWKLLTAPAEPEADGPIKAKQRYSHGLMGGKKQIWQPKNSRGRK